MAKSRVLTGARLVVYINDLPFAKISEFRWSNDTPVHEIYGIDLETPSELATSITKLSGNMTVFRLAGDGGAEGAGMAVQSNDLSRLRYFSITVVDRLTNQVVFEAKRCQLQGQSWDAPARGLVTGQLSWCGTAWSNETAQTG